MAKKNIKANNGHRRGKGNTPRRGGIGLFDGERLIGDNTPSPLRNSTPVDRSHHVVRRVEGTKDIAEQLPKSFLAHKAGSLIMQYIPVKRGGMERLAARKVINRLDEPNKLYVPIDALYIGKSSDKKRFPLYVSLDESIQYGLEEERSTITSSMPNISIGQRPLPSLERINLVTVEGKDNAEIFLDLMHERFEETIVLGPPIVLPIRN